MTPRQLEKLVAEWQHRLRLDDWDIEVVAIAAEQVDYQDGNTAICFTKDSGHSGRIVISTDRLDAEVEKSVVHELVHIVLDPMRSAHHYASQQLSADGEAVARKHANRVEEIAVQSLTETLLKLHRGEN